MEIKIEMTVSEQRFGTGFNTNQFKLRTKLKLYQQLQQYIICVARLADRLKALKITDRVEWCGFINKYRRLFMKDIDSNNIYQDVEEISKLVFLTPNKQNFYECERFASPSEMDVESKN